MDKMTQVKLYTIHFYINYYVCVKVDQNLFTVGHRLKPFWFLKKYENSDKIIPMP